MNTTTPISEFTGLVRYDAMCKAIAECAHVDEAMDIRDKAKALEVYMHQVNNRQAEQKVARIRLRAERKVGALLEEMKSNGQRDSGNGGNRRSRSSDSTVKLSDLGITKNQSSKFQKLAAIPVEDFEAALAKLDEVPSTQSVIDKAKKLPETAPDKAKKRDLPETPPPLPPDTRALWLWRHLKDFENEKFLANEPRAVCEVLSPEMRKDLARITPKVVKWLHQFLREVAPPRPQKRDRKELVQ